MLGIFFLQHIAQGNCGLEGALVWIAFSKDNGSFKTLIGDEKPDPNEPVIFFCIIGIVNLLRGIDNYCTRAPL